MLGQCETTELIESRALASFHSPHERLVTDLQVLDDDTFVSCSTDAEVKRWRVSEDKNSIELVGTFVGHTLDVLCVVQKGNGTIITGSLDETLKEWNVATCECLNTVSVMTGPVYCLLSTRDKRHLLYGTKVGAIETRGMSDLDQIVFTSKSIHSGPVYCLCELMDGSFVSGSSDQTLKRWSIKNSNRQEKELVLHRTFVGHKYWVVKVIELNRHTIVSGSKDCTLRMWSQSTGACLSTIPIMIGFTHPSLFFSHVVGLKKLSGDMFLSALNGKWIQLWGAYGNCIDSVIIDHPIEAMAVLRDTIITAEQCHLEIRQLK